MCTRRVTVIAAAVLAAMINVSSACAQRSSGGPSNSTAGRARPASDAPNSKWVFGIHTVAAPGVTVTGPDIDGGFSTQLGMGVGVMAGYELRPNLTGFVSLDLAKQGTGPDITPAGTFGLAHYEFGARLRLQPTNATMRPYVTGTIGQRALGARVTDLDTGESITVALGGRMVSFGGGVERALSPKLALDGGAEIAFGKFDRLTWDDDTYVGQVNGSTSIRLRGGLTWRP